MKVKLAEQLAAHPRFEWRPGVLTVDCWRVVDAYEDGTVRWVSDCRQMETRTPFGGPLRSKPDLTDDATAGCLLAMLGSGWSVYHHTEGHWVVNTLRADGPSRMGATLGEACAMALLALWERESLDAVKGGE